MAAIPISNNGVYVHNFSISDDGLTIDIHVETDAGYIIDVFNFWTDATFQDTSLAIDLSSLLSQTGNVEVFSVTASDAGVTSFYDGIFFGEFGTTAPATSGCDDCIKTLGVAAKLIAAKLCLMEKVLAWNVCADCNQGCKCIDKCDIIVLDKTIKAMTIALEFGYYTEAISLLNNTRTLCSTCSECLNLDNFISSSNSGLNYYTLNNTFILQ
jgi:hypothetical protein|tara:strand:- start:7022 stop:7657 length:636 start_codon:yes stop_codon:yes gene_type:complete